MSIFQAYLDLLKSEVVAAVGCTEPIAVALARSREVLGEKPQSIELQLSANIFKNAMSVGIPGTGITGLPIAAALGAVFGNSSDCLEVLKGVDDEAVAAAKTMVAENRVKIAVKKDVEKLYIEALCHGLNGNTSKAIITSKHSNISHIELNDEVLECSTENTEVKADSSAKPDNPILPLSVDTVFTFATEVTFEEIEFILKTVEYNKAISDEGLSKDYGLMVGRKLKGFVDRGILCGDLINNAMSITAAACDARMAGSLLPVMSISGSGNQGITATLPVYAVAQKVKADDEKLARALVLSHLTAIHIKSYLGRLSNEGCALKVSTGVAAAIQSALLALDGSVVSYSDGIIEEDIEQTIKNLGQIGSIGMRQADEMLLQIMVSKK